MRACPFDPSPSRARLPLTALGLFFLGLAACNPSDVPGSDDEDGTVAPDPEKTPACQSDVVGSDARFERTAGPSLSSFRLIAATPKVVLASTGTSLHRSLDEGSTWSVVDAAPLRGATIQAMAAHGLDVFVSVQSPEGGGVYRSADGGDSWTSVATDLVIAPYFLTSDGTRLFAEDRGQAFQWNAAAGAWDALPQADLAFDVIESDGKYLYANSLYVPGVYRIAIEPTGAADAVWTRVVDLPEWGYKAFAFNGARGFAANDEHVFETVDHGASWHPLTTSVLSVQDLLFADGSLYMATQQGIQASADGGATWTPVEDAQGTSPFALASSGAHVFVAGQRLLRGGSGAQWSALEPVGDSIDRVVATERAVIASTSGHLVRTVDGGTTWTEITLDGQPPYFQSLIVRHETGGDTVYALRVKEGGGFEILASRDDGETFQHAGDVPTNSYMGFLATTDDALVVGANEGAGAGCSDVQDITTSLFVSRNGGATWTSEMNTFPITFVDCYDESYTPMITGISEVEGTLFATTWWKGTYRSADDGQSWQPIASFDTTGAIGSVVDLEGALFATAEKGGIVRSTDAGVTWKAVALEGIVVSGLTRVGDTLFASVASADPEHAGVFASRDGARFTLVDAGFDARVAGVVAQGNKLFAGTLDASVWSVDLTCE